MRVGIAHTHPTGLLPDRAERRALEASEHAFEAAGFAAGPEPIIRPIAWIRDQWFPCCAGDSIGACCDAQTGGPMWASGVSLWRDARRRQGRLEAVSSGTRLEYVISSLVERGWDPYRPGEETDLVEAGLGAPPAGDDLADELAADDHRLAPGARRYRIIGTGADVLDAVDAALATGLDVVQGSGTREALQRYEGDPTRPDDILDERHFGGDHEGHAYRIAGRDTLHGVRIYLVQNSWGPRGARPCSPADAPRGWGGCHLPDGQWAPGCAWAHERVIAELAWDRVVLEVTR